MLIVDAQIHLWEKGTPSAHHRQEPYSAEEAIAGMDEAGVDAAGRGNARATNSAGRPASVVILPANPGCTRLLHRCLHRSLLGPAPGP